MSCLRKHCSYENGVYSLLIWVCYTSLPSSLLPAPWMLSTGEPSPAISATEGETKRETWTFDSVKQGHSEDSCSVWLNQHLVSTNHIQDRILCQTWSSQRLSSWPHVRLLWFLSQLGLDLAPYPKTPIPPTRLWPAYPKNKKTSCFSKNPAKSGWQESPYPWSSWLAFSKNPIKSFQQDSPHRLVIFHPLTPLHDSPLGYQSPVIFAVFRMEPNLSSHCSTSIADSSLPLKQVSE